MIKVATKFTENIWDNEANAEIPFKLAYTGEALSVSAQEDGLTVEQKVNGRTCGMFFKYKDLSSLAINDSTVEDFMDLDNIESAVAEAMAVKKLTILGEHFKIYEDAAGTTAVDFSEDINITNEFNNGAPLNWYIKLYKNYQIQMIESENAVVEIGKINTNGLYPFTVKGIVGNVLIQMTVAHNGNGIPYEVGSVVIGGRTYRTVTLGTQTWLSENLDFKFDGLKIGDEVAATGEPYAAYYNNDEATYGVDGNKYGLLYNWYAVAYLNEHKDEIIPGWHVPSNEEWETLLTAIGGKFNVNKIEEVAYNKLKSETGWNELAGTDDYGFSVFPTGSKIMSGQFFNLGNSANYWIPVEKSSSEGYCAEFWNRSMSLDDNYKKACFPLRLVKDK